MLLTYPIRKAPGAGSARDERHAISPPSENAPYRHYCQNPGSSVYYTPYRNFAGSDAYAGLDLVAGRHRARPPLHLRDGAPEADGRLDLFPSSLGLVLKPLFPGFVDGNAYFQTIPLSIGWEHMLVLGIPIGGFLAYKLSGEKVAAESGGLSATSPLTAFLGGFLVLFGARMAGGCTTGHVLSGMSQLSVAGFLFAAAVFAGGIPAALLLKRRWS